jgi:hypothetical protein
MKPEFLTAEIQFDASLWSSRQSAWTTDLYLMVDNALTGRGLPVAVTTFMVGADQGSFGLVTVRKGGADYEFQLKGGRKSKDSESGNSGGDTSVITRREGSISANAIDDLLQFVRERVDDVAQSHALKLA